MQKAVRSTEMNYKSSTAAVFTRNKEQWFTLIPLNYIPT